MREDAVSICERDIAGPAAACFGAARERLKKFADFEGCQNVVYEYERDGQPLILRISYRPDRPPEQIEAELDFVNYLAEHGAGVSRPILSCNGRLLEMLVAEGVRFIAVSFVKGKGMRVPDNGYRYRPGAPIEEYFQNWGRMLGRMHALAKRYRPASAALRRPDWFQTDRFVNVEQRVPERLPRVREKLNQLMVQLRALPVDGDAYGLVHGDFNDGNFTVDYDTGEITVFDFDDCCYFWFMYELACAWEGGVGRAMFEPLVERKAFMTHYFQHVLEGYSRENTLDAEWLARLPLFLQVVQMEEYLHYAQYIDRPDEEVQAGLRYKVRCIEEGIPYLGFFDPIYSPDRPFAA